MNLKLIRNSAFLILGFFLGFISTEYSYFVFDETIGLLDLVSFIITTFIGVYIVRVLQKNESVLAAEKDILIKDSSNLIKLLIEVESTVSNRPIVFDETIALVKTLKNKYVDLDISIGHSSFDRDNSFHDKMNQNIREINRELTSGSVEDGRINLNQQNLVRLETVLRDSKSLLKKFIFNINKR